MLEQLAPLTELTTAAIYTIALIFTRVAGVVTMLPGFGEQTIPMRVRLVMAVAFTIIAWPLIAPLVPIRDGGTMDFLPLFASEALIGTLLGLVIRMMVMALQLAGSIAAQATSIAQIMGAGATPDPMPALGNILVMGGLTLAVTGGVHIKAVEALAYSYEVLPFGLVPIGSNVAPWGVSQAAGAFALAFTLAAPFVITALAYYVTLGFINRAMPQLMVAFIGAPAITAGSLLLLFLCAPILLTIWNGRLDNLLANPFGLSP